MRAPDAPAGEPLALRRGAEAAGVASIALMAILLQAYAPVKAAALLAFVLLGLLRFAHGATVTVSRRLVAYYLLLSVAGIAWALVAVAREGNAAQGVVDAVRLYVAWSGVYVLAFTLLGALDGLLVVHRGLVAAGIGIALLNFIGIADQFFGWQLISADARVALDQFIGFEDGYVRVNSQNIGALFLVAPYLVAFHLRTDSGAAWSGWSKLSLALTLLLVVASGRRALWLAVAAVPVLVLGLALATGSWRLLHRRVRRTMLAGGALGLLVAVPLLPGAVRSSAQLQHVARAFSAQDERSIQRGYLLDGASEVPIVGSGFGAYAGYLRSDDRPWTYELTYHQLLYNTGIVGVVLVGGLVAWYLLWAVLDLRRGGAGTAIPFAVVVGFVSVLIGAYSNPYLRSFDYLFLAGLLPFIVAELGRRPAVSPPRVAA